MKKTTKWDRLISIWVAVGITIIVVFLLLSIILSGTACNGYQENGVFFIGGHEGYLEVSEFIWRFSYTLEILFWIALPLTPIGAFTISKIQTMSERKKVM